jgi:streptogramin lyase
VGTEAGSGFEVRTVLCLAGFAAAVAPLTRSAAGQDRPLSSSAWLSQLPDGEAKRKFILDCTGCHQFDEKIARPAGRFRTEAEWAEAVTRMLGYAGARSGFPVIAADRDPTRTAAWLTRHLRHEPIQPQPSVAGAPADVTEFCLPEAGDLPHDVAVEASGSVLITGMFTHKLYRLDPGTGRFSEIAIPVEKANPRAIDIDSQGRIWVVLGMPKKLAVLAGDSAWRTFDVGVYPHSLAIGRDRKVWFNGHFTHAPELIGSVDPASGGLDRAEVPAHPALSKGPGGPIPYELRVGPDGRVWGSELIGNRLFAYSPETEKFETFDLPTPHSGPRRFDIDARGIVWIPAYAANRLVRLDPRTRSFDEIPIPVRDAVPYVVRADPATGGLWIGTSAADALLHYDPVNGRFETYPLPARGALVRHLAVDHRSGAVWVAYGASPGIPARVARLERR